jgi:hypothetical protein
MVDVATPWAERRRDSSDFNDALRAGGMDAVRARIKAAVQQQPRTKARRPDHEMPTQTVQQVRAETKDAIAQSLSNPYHPGGSPRHVLIRSEVGIGKSTHTLDTLAKLIEARKAVGEPHRVLYVAPSTDDWGARVCSHLNTGQREDLNQSRVAAMAMPAA